MPSDPVVPDTESVTPGRVVMSTARAHVSSVDPPLAEDDGVDGAAPPGTKILAYEERRVGSRED